MKRALILTLGACALALALAPGYRADQSQSGERAGDSLRRRCRISSSCRRTCTSAKASASPPIPRGTSSSTRAAATRGCSSSTRTATYVREIGQGLYGLEFAHAVRVDTQDNIWAVDEGTNMVIKFNPEGRVVMVLGRRPEPVEELFDSTPAGGARARSRTGSDRPTDVTWDAQGNIFVSDGYVNSRVVKYDKNGRFLKSVGDARHPRRAR